MTLVNHFQCLNFKHARILNNAYPIFHSHSFSSIPGYPSSSFSKAIPQIKHSQTLFLNSKCRKRNSNFLKLNTSISNALTEADSKIENTEKKNLDQLILTKISIAQSTGTLDLSDCGLNEIPSSVFQISDLTDLSLAGNNLEHLPNDIKNLKNLRRLGLAGNNFSELPQELGLLKKLEGLWIHGNILKSIPTQVYELSNLKVLALAGNKLNFISPKISNLNNLKILSLAGNEIEEMPKSIGNLENLQILALFGNKLRNCPKEFENLHSLIDLWLQGNQLSEIYFDFSKMNSLKQLSLADNFFFSLPENYGHFQNLQSLWLYGNKIQNLPHSISNAKKLSSIWIENNPIDSSSLFDVISSFSNSKNIKNIGIDYDQAINLPIQFLKDNKSFVSISHSSISNHDYHGGYFKIQPWNSILSATNSHYLLENKKENKNENKIENKFEKIIEKKNENNLKFLNSSKILIVAFGSAPAVPNWGGLLKKVKTELKNKKKLIEFDILYVVDSRRSWYSQSLSLNSQSQSQLNTLIKKQVNNDFDEGKRDEKEEEKDCDEEEGMEKEREGEGDEYYSKRIEKIVKNYRKVMFLGDSMGASACLLFSSFAHHVVAFSPQVDLSSSSIRPGRRSDWLKSYKDKILSSVSDSNACIQVHSGTWSHDVEQANWLTSLSNVEVIIHGIDDHRLAKYLDEKKELVNIVENVLDQLHLELD